jgi:ribonuclease HI
MPKIFYTDATVKYLLKEPYSNTAICVTNENGSSILFEFIAECSINMAEALAIHRCLEIHPGEIIIRSDCKGVVDFINRWELKSKNNDFQTLIEIIREKSRNATVEWIPRAENIAGKLISRLWKLSYPEFLTRVRNPLFS